MYNQVSSRRSAADRSYFFLKMLKIYVSTCFCLYLTVGGIVGTRGDARTKSTTSKPELSLLDKFHQNDYKLTFEWTETIRVNKHLANYHAVPFKHNRTTTAVNCTFSVNDDMGYDVEVIVQIYKFASNEYRVFPIHFELNFCEAITKDVMGSKKFSRIGNFSCPLLKGRPYVIVNWVPEGSKLPPFIPTGKYMMELQYLYHSQEVLLTRDYGSVSRPMVGFED